MKTLSTLLLNLTSLIAFSQTQIKDSTLADQNYSYITGLTRKAAIPIDSRTPREGLLLEYKWINQHYPNSKILDFIMEGDGEDKPQELYDIYYLKLPNNKRLFIYFRVLHFNMNI